MPEVIETRRRMADFAERLRSGKCFGHKEMPIRDVVNIGIGGSIRAEDDESGPACDESSGLECALRFEPGWRADGALAADA